jgi:diguanylate cyclase (GGDEF)-like protein
MRLISDPVPLQPAGGAGNRAATVATAAAIAAGLLLIFWLDRISGAAPVEHLYYLPIIFAGIRLRRAAGLLAAAAAVALYHLANPALLTWRYEESDIVQIALFVAVALVTARLAEDTRQFRRLAATDDLTGLHNLRSFEAHLALMIRTCRTAAVPLAMLVLDVDHLKSINDTHGHLAGAETVRHVGQMLGANLPAGAVACRYGGDEFAVAMPGMSETRARAFAEEFRSSVGAAAPVLDGKPFPAQTISISIGLASLPFRLDATRGTPQDDVELGEHLFRAADRALYVAKQQGRDRVHVSHAHG